MRRGLGRYVTGDDFHGREIELDEFIRRIREGAHQLIIAQRRMGKTSLLRETELRLTPDYHCVYIDFSPDRSPEDFVARFGAALKEKKEFIAGLKALNKNFMQGFKDNIEEISAYKFRIKLRANLDESNWEEEGDVIFNILNESDKPILLMFDEFPIMVNNMLKNSEKRITAEKRIATERFMYWLRAKSQNYQGKIRIVLSGSIGFEPVLNQAGLTASINNYYPYHLEPWDEETAIECIQKLAITHDVNFEKNAPKRMIELLGCSIPHHIQMFFAFVDLYCKRKEERNFLLSEVDVVYKKEMLGSRGHAELTHYESRLQDVLNPEYFMLALDMLNIAAIDGVLTQQDLTNLRNHYSYDGMSVVDVQREILEVLEHDGYLKRTNEGFTFISKLLKDWWEGKNKFLHIPLEDR